MKTLFVSLALAVGLVLAQTDEDLVKCMKQVGPTCGKVKKDLEAKSNKDAAEGATKLAGMFVFVEKYWTAKNAADAIKFAKDAQDAAKDVAMAAGAGHDEHAQSSFKTLLGNCQGCHNAHREKNPDGSWKIKL
jgi:mono/diheme cytochrome c family protein